MSFREPHDLHKRRWSRNLGLGVVLAVFVSLVFGLTIAKVSQSPIQLPGAAQTGEGN
ncbi:hypothetical protein OB2597_15855 [Pseudooceanicola batsensis HTCC2597]|uniref:Cytochrome C oxidase assembly protein n=1 Tax=Pseudooceanicola batsensis (strain ATCC BAA-863 / DSM 15984 / KCTC 12145 / HTCC2597) TaxID=252305 RepID=A3TZ53_PSEBH|nr:hypothetical protein [Pseudooceanicola batsensis]EAQ02871.1 hypothetical protein OB2597_15855 [Pseudooceanicola batsensis HTCC2597]